VSQGWSIDLSRDAVFQSGDRLALRVAQPLRVQAGGLAFDLPSAYSYDTLTASGWVQHLSLVPKGREIVTELAWRGSVLGGSGAASLFHRSDPGHNASYRDETGVAATWSMGF
jgi:hypothetical protein